MRIRRGEIRWADLDPRDRRPVLVLSQDVFNERSGTVVAVALTRRPQRAGFPLVLRLSASPLPPWSWLKVGQVRTLSTERIGDLLGEAGPEELAQAVEGLGEIIGG
ncbi:MAG TPA: type II toxin-antitoxin system PemK/MazF family toxin [Longimicrobiaceae bacterium]